MLHNCLNNLAVEVQMRSRTVSMDLNQPSKTLKHRNIHWIHFQVQKQKGFGVNSQESKDKL